MGNKAVKSTEQLAQLCIEGLDDLSLNGANEKSIEQVGLTIQAIKNSPIPDTQFPVFRM